MKFAITVVRGIEDEFPDLAGVREGEACSDVLAAILVRLEHEQGAVARAEAAEARVEELLEAEAKAWASAELWKNRYVDLQSGGQ